MGITEITPKTIIKKHKIIDSWFISRYSFNIYRGCFHDCVYCDGRAEKYHVEGTFGQDIAAKTNLPGLLKKELSSLNKRNRLIPGFIIPGGGVGDSYQPLEQKYRLMRQTLEICKEFKMPVQILTKSDLVLDDLKLIETMNKEGICVVCNFSFSTVNDKIASIFEPGCTPPSARLKAMKEINDAGIYCGFFYMPVLPLITDSVEEMTNIFDAAKGVNADYMLFGGMTLKPGRQREYYSNVLNSHYPQLIPFYKKIYKDNKWGNPEKIYSEKLYNRFNELVDSYKIPLRVPQYIYKDVLSINDRVVLALLHYDFYLKMKNVNAGDYIKAAKLISEQKTNINEMLSIDLIPDISSKAKLIINEILKSGFSESLATVNSEQ